MKLLKGFFILIGIFLLLIIGYPIYEKLFSIESQKGYQSTNNAEVTIIDKGYNEADQEYWVKGIVSHLEQNDEDYESTYFIVKKKSDWEKMKTNVDYVMDYYIIEKIKRDNIYIPIVKSFEEKLG